MTETIDHLIQARFDAIANLVDDGDWNDVLARARRAEPVAYETLPRRFARLEPLPRRVALAAAVVALAATVTAVAFSWPQTLINFFRSPPAPEKIVNFFGAQNVGAPSGMNPNAIPGQARKITTSTFDVTGKHPDHPALHTLYIAPRKSGGFCYLWTNYSGGCVDAKATPTYARTHPAARPLGVTSLGNDYPILVNGWIRTGSAKTIEARFADGTTETIPITWVSEPINAGFFVYPIPSVHQTRSDALASIVALDANGSIVAKQSFRLTEPLDQNVMQTLPDGTKYSLPRRADAAAARKIISFRATNGSQVYLWVMPRTGGGLCFLFNQGEGCLAPGLVAQLPIINGGLFGGGKNRVLLFAQAKPDVATIELRYQNGEREALTPVDGFVLHEITPSHYKPGTRLAAALALNQNGKAIYKRHFQPKETGLYPCQKPINRGYGVKTCP